MFRIDICEPRQVALVRFQGQLTEADFAALDKLAQDVRDRAAFDCIYDMTDVQRIDLATSFVAGRGELPQAYKDRALVYVAARVGHRARRVQAGRARRVVVEEP